MRGSSSCWPIPVPERRSMRFSWWFLEQNRSLSPSGTLWSAATTNASPAARAPARNTATSVVTFAWRRVWCASRSVPREPSRVPGYAGVASRAATSAAIRTRASSVNPGQSYSHRDAVRRRVRRRLSSRRTDPASRVTRLASTATAPLPGSVRPARVST